MGHHGSKGSAGAEGKTRPRPPSAGRCTLLERPSFSRTGSFCSATPRKSTWQESRGGAGGGECGGSPARPEGALLGPRLRLSSEELDAAQAALDRLPRPLPAGQDEDTILMVGVSKGGHFAAYADVFLGSCRHTLQCDSACGALVLPCTRGAAEHDPLKSRWTAAPGFQLLAADVLNSWGQPSLLMEGPVTLGARTFTCVFYATIGRGRSGMEPVGSLGVGMPRMPATVGNWTVLSPLYYSGARFAALTLRADAADDGELALAEPFRVHLAGSALALSSSSSPAADRGFAMLDLAEEPVMQVNLKALRLQLAPCAGAGAWDVDVDCSGQQCVAVLDISSGPLGIHGVGGDALQGLVSNACPPGPLDQEQSWAHGQEVRYFNGRYELELWDKYPNHGTCTIRAGSSRPGGCTAAACCSSSSPSPGAAPAPRGLGGQPGVVLGSLFALNADILIDLVDRRVGIRARHDESQEEVHEKVYSVRL